MNRTLKTSFWGLAACLSALALAPAANVNADTGLACSSLVTSVADGAEATNSLAVVKTEKLYRWQQRPWAKIPEGAALYVKVPAGTTAADLHNMATTCARAGEDQRSPLCVAGATIAVRREGGLYVLRITSDSRGNALEIQRRAAQL